MDKDNVISLDNRELFSDPLTDLIRNEARQLIATARWAKCMRCCWVKAKTFKYTPINGIGVYFKDGIETK